MLLSWEEKELFIWNNEKMDDNFKSLFKKANTKQKQVNFVFYLTFTHSLASNVFRMPENKIGRK
jgi:hypothetical protein